MPMLTTIRNSPTWRRASPSARALYVEMCMISLETQSQTVVLSCRRAAHLLGCARDTAHKLLRELESIGAIQKGESLQGNASSWVMVEMQEFAPTPVALIATSMSAFRSQ